MFKLISTMRRGSSTALPAAFAHYPTMEAARLGTVALLRGLGDERVRVLDGGGQGLVHALNLGLAAARGRLIARMDADDECHPRRLEWGYSVQQCRCPRWHHSRYGNRDRLGGERRQRRRSCSFQWCGWHAT